MRWNWIRWRTRSACRARIFFKLFRAQVGVTPNI